MDKLNFINQWLEGIKNLTPAQLLHSKLIGNWGQLIGMLLAFIVLLWKGYWYFGLFMVFALFLQIIALIEVNQQYKNFCKMINIQKEIEKNLEGE